MEDKDDDMYILKISKGKNQNRVTLPKEVDSVYVAVKPVHESFSDFFKPRRKK